mmetsp:Transcript_10068/g.21256  ORF Transcript_10068/g.21256 Transcript_10068/m.21256 type:complete len:230 (-) Transcript_10068:253-942(-)|eukprot:CAMPEP_0183306576 /NCGR_PEP_ID=MMETSP0160_2-20130417/12786_1 /TAXON_ID=2839 ORGANISM="Odontella Sinensis, Strain Grunow 1884" /NCGR_SAMPLE_ID=MMETSP0160_2 /ASSEMBLY_ACC=CAM_ASM_000250 /LENGTH=229 /DNA_ID=CAMNT_0025469989 /DNA_START=45 /DNA_END=734 /DNA_ORIENTATION=-
MSKHRLGEIGVTATRWPGRGEREIWASYNDETVRVYQAYRDEIADAALEAQSFVPPWKTARTTWIKPSMTWMAYRSGWAKKDKGQSRILAVDLKREWFDWLLEHAVLAKDQGPQRCREVEAPLTDGRADIVVQWDPERDLGHSDGDHFKSSWLTHRLPGISSLQMGLRGETAKRYASEFVASIIDVTDSFSIVYERLQANDIDGAAALLEPERLYPFPSRDLAILQRSE